MRRLARSMAWAELRGRDKGLRGSSSVWLGIWVIATAYRYLQRWASPDPVVVREVLRPGEQLVVTHYPKGTEPEPPPKRTRRARRRAARSA